MTRIAPKTLALPKKATLALAIQSLVCAHASAATFNVENLNSAGEGSLFAAIEQANNTAGEDTISFADGLSGSLVIEGASQLPVIAESLTINGPGSETLSIINDQAGSSNPLFLLDSAEQITLSMSDLTLAFAGSDSQNASLIKTLNGGHVNELELSNMVFDGNNDNSSGLDTQSATVVVEHSTFTEFGGSAVKTGATNLTIRDSEFSDNQNTENSRASGAAVNARESSLIIENTRFDNNSIDAQSVEGATEANAFGGAISIDNRFNEGSQGNLSISGSTFSNNSANAEGAARGGAIDFWYRANNMHSISIDNSTFENNSTSTTVDGFVDYPSTLGGGAVNIVEYSELRSAPNNSDVSIKNTVFSGNESNRVGGAVHVSGTLDVDIEQSLFKDNQAADGSAIYTRAATYEGSPMTSLELKVSNSSFIENNINDAFLSPSGNGGAIRNTARVATHIVNSTFSGNSSTPEFKESSISNSGEMQILNSTFATDAFTYGSTTIDNTNVTADSLTIVNTIIDVVVPEDVVIEGAPSEGVTGLKGVVTMDGSILHNPDSVADITDPTPDESFNQFDTDPMLAPLTNNGGILIGANSDTAIPTHALLEGSPAIGAADATAVSSDILLPSDDQRGAAYPRTVDSLDIGAIEYNSVTSHPVVDDAIPELVLDSSNAINHAISDYFTDDGALRFSSNNLPEGLSLSEQGQLTGNLAPDLVESLPISFDVAATDNEGLSTSGSITLQAAPIIAPSPEPSAIPTTPPSPVTMPSPEASATPTASPTPEASPTPAASATPTTSPTPEASATPTTTKSSGGGSMGFWLFSLLTSALFLRRKKKAAS
ncbi:choice-of-anchor Q domain-containing protein [Agaribacterium sp. ZY112]|uniref:choice-of-anchor Q domain-containing protein n=1 Tax=Agaribacterium sp. ZY112 TaxID=3233574 RepID=UPI003523AED2